MQFNKHDEKQRYYRELEKKWAEAYNRLRKPEYEPLEKPYAIGWDVFLDIHPNVKMDEHRVNILRQVVGILNLHRIYFTRKVNVVKFFRRNKYEFSNILYQASQEDVFTHYYDKFDYWYWKSISWKQYEGLSEQLKKYFTPYDSYRGRHGYEKRARVNFYAFNYSHNENDYIVVKVKRAFATKRVIPDGEAQATYWKNWQILRNSGYWNGSWHWRAELPKDRKKWKDALKAILRVKDYKDYSMIEGMPTEAELFYNDIREYISSYSDVEEEIFVKHKLFKRKY